MVNRKEKLDLLSEMIAFANYDKKEDKKMEYVFLLGVSKQLDIPRKDFDYLIDNSNSYKYLKIHSERIIQFHKLVLLIDIDLKKDNNKKDIVKLYNLGLRMGLNFNTINKVLYLMNSFPNKFVPECVLIDVIKVQYN